MSLAARYGINRLIDSRNCYTLIQKGFVIQASHYRAHEPIRTLEEINAKDKAGIIFSPSVESVLKRRLYFKNMQKSFSVNSNEWLWCHQRIDSLKGILVGLYGTTGSFWNRFANVLVFEEINRLARDVLIKTKDIVQAYCFELLYADTDAVFLNKDGAPIEEYENVTKILSKEIGPLFN